MSSRTNSGGIGLLGALGLMFIGLKLTGYIDWSWWLVTLPFWGGFVIGFLIAFTIGFAKAITKKYFRIQPLAHVVGGKGAEASTG